MLVGYARVSTADQTIGLQRDALTSAGCERLFTDPASAARADRPGLDEALDFLRPGDTLIVWRLDRLGRSLRHLIDTLTALQARGISFRSLQEQIGRPDPRSAPRPPRRSPLPSTSAFLPTGVRPPASSG